MFLRSTHSNIFSYDRGATVLLRDSIPPPDLPFDPTTPELPATSHIAITSHSAPVFERVGPHLFTFSANSFFQNNNSILLPLVDYVKNAIFPPDLSPSIVRPTHLVDTYCGSGLFAITLSGEFQRVAGVEIQSESIEAARRNAIINGLEEGAGGKMDWVCGKAEEIFKDLPKGFKGGNSCVIIDVRTLLLLYSPPQPILPPPIPRLSPFPMRFPHIPASLLSDQS
jgi:tRNA (uracil-5-)-methyltransferase